VPPAPQAPAPKPAAPEVAAATPEKMPAPAPTPKPKPAPPQPEAKPTPPAPAAKPKPQQPAQDDFATLLKNLEKQKQQQQQTDQPPQRRPQPAQPQPQAPAAPQRQQAASLDDRRAAAGLAQMVKDQVTPCWNIPAGARDARDLRIVVVIELNPDGTLRGKPAISDVSRYESDAFFRAAAESALRALQNPRCSPLKLPYEMYETWKKINFTFDPKEVIG
jgi:outer membrane biosynthesis protein TonB